MGEKPSGDHGSDAGGYGKASGFCGKGYSSHTCFLVGDFPDGSACKVSACNVGDQGSIPGLGRSSGEGNGNPLQASCLKNPKDRGAWRVTVHGIAKSRTQRLILYETPTHLGSSPFRVLSFCLFILFMGFSRHEC